MCGCMWCVYVWRGEGGGGGVRGQHCGTILSQRNCFEKNWYTSVAHVSFDEIHRTVIT